MRIIIYIALGILAGVWLYLSIGTFIVVLMAILAGVIVFKHAATQSERRFLNIVFIISIFLGILFSCGNFYLAALTKHDSDLIADGSVYSTHGAYIAEVLTRHNHNIEKCYTDMLELQDCRNVYRGSLPNYGHYRMGFLSYFYGFLYTLFGYSPLMIKFLNTLLGIIGCFLIYFWMRDIFGEDPARIALLLTLFWPSRFLWATTGLKDTPVFFSFSVFLFVFYQLYRNFSLFWAIVILFATFIKYNFVAVLFLLVIAILIFKRRKIFQLLGMFLLMKLAFILLYQIRVHFVAPMMISLGISLVIFLDRKKIVLLTTVMIVLSTVFLLKVDKDILKKQYQSKTLYLITVQKGQAEMGEYVKSKYKIYPLRFYGNSVPLDKIPPISFLELFISYLIGMSYHFLSPFPWSLGSKMQIFGYLQSPLIYLLLPFIIIGLIVGVRYRWRQVLPYCMTTFIFASTQAMLLGNAGTLFRHRDMIMPFFISFAGIGLALIFGKLHLTTMPDER